MTPNFGNKKVKTVAKNQNSNILDIVNTFLHDHYLQNIMSIFSGLENPEIEISQYRTALHRKPPNYGILLQKIKNSTSYFSKNFTAISRGLIQRFLQAVMVTDNNLCSRNKKLSYSR